MRSLNKKNYGFTLIELLVVIAIIGLLTALFIAALGTARNQAQKTRAKADLNRIIEAAIMAQGESGKALLKITGSGCSSCACSTGKSLVNDSSSCYTNWKQAITKISDASFYYQDIRNLDRDPWGSPYLLDENETEGGNCGADTINSAGTDGISGTSDDIHMQIPKSGFCP